MKQNRNVVRLTESQLKQMIAESVKMVLREGNDIESWWRHNGSWDREQASGIPYNGQDNYLSTTDDWWNSLTETEKEQIYNEFFEEY